MALTRTFKATESDPRSILIEKVGLVTEDSTKRWKLTARILRQVFDGAAEDPDLAKFVEVAVLMEAGTPADGAYPASALIGAGKPFADAAAAIAWRSKMVEVYQALRALAGLDP